MYIVSMDEDAIQLQPSFIEKYNVLIKHEPLQPFIQSILNKRMTDRPFYLIHLDRLFSAYQTWNNELPMVKPFYAVKSNNHPVVLEVMASIGLNFDCASEKEIELVDGIVKDGTRILYANPCKPISHLQYAKQKDVQHMTFDSEEELYKVKLYHPQAQLILRIAVDDTKSLLRFNRKFGCKLEEIKDLLSLVKQLNLNFLGFSFHVGSLCSLPIAFYEALRSTRCAVDIASGLALETRVVDMGGGFPGDRTMFAPFATEIRKGMFDFFHGKNIRFLAEPGRFFSEAAQTLVMSVIGKKRIQVKGEVKYAYFLNDGVYGGFGSIHYDKLSPNLRVMKQGNLFKTTFYGPTCDSMDVLVEDYLFPELFLGDCVYHENFGAYTSVSATEFNGYRVDDCIFCYDVS
jgi:ornithine decarboxylase